MKHKRWWADSWPSERAKRANQCDSEPGSSGCRRRRPLMSQELQQTFDRAVEEGEYRINRGWQSLLATGAVGGLDVAMGVLALLLVKHETGSDILAALAFPIGFIALTLANSELFTENFLVPIAA